jgi:hypothetical protein
MEEQGGARLSTAHPRRRCADRLAYLSLPRLNWKSGAKAMCKSTSLNRLLEAIAGRSQETVPWLGALEEEARTSFAGNGLPTRSIESWRYSDLSRAPAVLFENGVLKKLS